MTTPSTTEYQDLVVVITGTRKGLGRILAGHFLEQGAQVVGLSRGEPAATHPRYEHHTTDIRDDRAVRDTLLSVGRSYGSVDIVVNNAAVTAPAHAMMTPASQAEEMVQTNLLGAFYVSREAAKLMRRARYGRIINIGSIAGVLAPAGNAMYAATKAASMTLTAALAKEFADYGITVNTVGVTALQTDMLDQLSDDYVSSLVASLPISRLATADDIINVIDFFASPRSGYVTAQTVFLGGVHQ